MPGADATNRSTHVAPGLAILALAALAIAGGWLIPGCGGSPAKPTSSTTIPSSTSTTIPGEVSLHYVGTFAQPAPAPSRPIDLSLSVSERDVRGGYNTGAGGFTGSIKGTLDGTVDNGVFTGTITANLGNCVAERSYSGPVSRQKLNWSPGAQINTCGGTTPLVSPIDPPASPTPATTSTSTPSSSTSILSSTTTTTIGTSTSTSSISSSTSSTSSTTTSTSTSTSSTTTTLAPQSTLVFTFTPNPVSPATTGCSGGPTPYGWLYTIRIQNTSAVPFTLSSWRYGPGGVITSTLQNSVFQQVFSTTTIGAGSQVQGSFCTWLTSPNGGQVQFTLVGTSGNGPHTSGFVTLSSTEPAAPFALARR